MLDSEVNRLPVLGCENDNMRLQSESRDLENDIRSMKEASFDRERAEEKHDIQVLEEVQRSEEWLGRQVEDARRSSEG